MNTKEALEAIKKLVFSEEGKQEEAKEVFSLTEAKLVDGTVVKYDLETADIFVVGQDGTDVPAPVGEHQLETGEVLVVTEEGKIAEVKEAEAPAEEATEAPMEEGMADDKFAQFEAEFKALVDKVSKMETELADLKGKNEKMSEAVMLSTQVIEAIAKEPSDKAIQKPNTFSKELKDEKEERFANLQKAFQNLKTK
jgi:hypothetical protein